MRDDELLAIYGATRQLAEGMTARDAELKQSTAALEATIAQVRQLPAMLGQQTSKYIAAGIREVVQEDFKQPIEKAIEGPIRSIEVAAYHAREAVGHLKEEARFQTWTVFALILALGFALGAFGTYFFFTRQVSALNSRFDHLEQLLVAPPCSSRHPRPDAAGREEAWAALKAGYGFDAQALGTRIQPASHKPTASAASMD